MRKKKLTFLLRLTKITKHLLFAKITLLLQKGFVLLVIVCCISNSWEVFIYNSMFHWHFLITYMLSVSLKFGVCYKTGQWGEFRVKNGTLRYIYFYGSFSLLFNKKFVFYHYHFLFWWSMKLPRQNINQSETRIDYKKPSVELYVRLFLR